MAGYLGSVPVPQATQHRETFTATAGQTTFNTAGYTPLFIDVYLNGVHLSPADITATNGSDVVLGACVVDDIVDVVSYTPFEVASQTFTGTTTMTDVVAATLDISGNIDIDGTTNLDVVDIDGAVNMATTALVTGVLTTTAATVFNGGFASNGDSTVGGVFTVNGGAENTVAKFESTDAGCFIVLEDNGSTNNGNRIQVEGDVMTFSTADAARLTIAADGAVSTPTAGTSNVRLGVNAGDSIVSGANYNVAIGDEAGTSLTNGALNNVLVGYQAGTLVAGGDNNVLLGYQAGDAITSASNNIAIGKNALGAEDTHDQNIAIGSNALAVQDAGTDGNNVAIGHNAGLTLNTGINNTILGSLAAAALTTADDSVIIGFSAGGGATLTGHDNVLIGRDAGHDLTSGAQNVFIGREAGDKNDDGNGSVIIGHQAGGANFGDGLTSVGSEAGAIVTGVRNAMFGYQAGKAITSGTDCLFAGYQAGLITTGSNNCHVGTLAGKSNTSGDSQTFCGTEAGFSTTGRQNTFIGRGAGYNVTSGFDNTIIGRYSGNFGNLDIRESNNNIVLSDGDGNPRMHIDSNATAYFGKQGVNPDADLSSYGNILATGLGGAFGYIGLQINVGGFTGAYDVIRFRNGNGRVGTININGSSTSYGTSSDYRLKENVDYTWDATTRLKQLKPARFNWISDANTTVDGFLAHEAQTVVPEAVIGTHNEVDDDGVAVMQSIDQSKLVPLLVKTIQELEARITALEGA